MASIPQRNVLIIYALALTVAVVAFSTIPWWTVDDAFISYRYGRNLVYSGQLTWNAGEEPPVEGYTGILLPLLAAGILALELPLIESIKLLGILALIATLFLCVRTLRHWGASPLTQSLAVLFMAATPLIYIHSISGLETIFFACFVMGSCWGLALQASANSSRTQDILLGLFVFLAGLCRPEGIALAGIIALWHFIFALRGQFRSLDLTRFACSMAAFLLLMGYWVVRAMYYESFFPNSYHAKAYDGWINLESLLAMGKFVGYYCCLPLLALLILKVNGKRVFATFPFRFFGPLLIWMGTCLATYLHSHLWMNYSARFFFPFLPIIIVLVARAMDAELATMQAHPPKGAKRHGLRLMLGAVACIQAGTLAYRFHQEWAFLTYYDSIVKEELIPAGKYLAAHLHKDATVISYMDAGAVGYYSGLHVIDFGRLNDRYLAQQNPSREAVVEYFFQQGADAVIMTSESRDSLLYIDEAMAVAADSRFSDYHLTRQWDNSAGFPYWQRLYLRK